PRESGDRDAVQHLAGHDAADLEAEEARRRVEGERLRTVDREWPAGAWAVQRPDLLDDLVCCAAGHVEVRGVDATEIHVLAVLAHDRVVSTRGALDSSGDASCRGVDDAPGPFARTLPGRHVDGLPVRGDRHAVDAV